MTGPLMPKATAVWLIDNTALSFEQIAAFCGLHALEVQAIADGEVAVGIVGLDPISNGQLTREEIQRCESDPSARLQLAETKGPRPAIRTGPRYTPVAKRQERPDAIAWLVKNYPELSDAQISKLVGTTKATITSVRDRTHWKGANLKQVDPVDIGLCSYEDLLSAVQVARKRKAKAEERAAAEAARQGTGTEDGTDSGTSASPAADSDRYSEHLPSSFGESPGGAGERSREEPLDGETIGDEESARGDR